MKPSASMHFVLSDEALENYGERFRGVILTCTWIANHSVHSSEFFDPKSPRYQERYGHPGYDEGVSPMKLYDVEGKAENGETFEQAVYEWEVIRVK